MVSELGNDKNHFSLYTVNYSLSSLISALTRYGVLTRCARVEAVQFDDVLPAQGHTCNRLLDDAQTIEGRRVTGVPTGSNLH